MQDIDEKRAEMWIGTTTWLAQLGEHQTGEREVAG